MYLVLTSRTVWTLLYNAVSGEKLMYLLHLSRIRTMSREVLSEEYLAECIDIIVTIWNLGELGSNLDPNPEYPDRRNPSLSILLPAKFRDIHSVKPSPVPSQSFPILYSQDSSVGIVTGYGLDGQGSIPGRGKKFSLLNNVQIQWVPRAFTWE
jgi:hypothetical protein